MRPKLSRLHAPIVYTILLYLILNYGIQVVQIGGLPLAELIMLFGLATLLWGKGIPQFFSVLPIALLAPWWGSALIHLLFEIPEYGFWAIRDASHVLESLYLIIGFSLFGYEVKWLASKLKVFFMLIIVYAFLYPFSQNLQAISPEFTGAQGQSVPILFNYINTATLIIVAGYWLLIQEQNRKFSLFVAAILFGYVIMAFQSRTTYLQFAVIMMFVLYEKPGHIPKIAIGLIGGAIAISVMPLLGISFEGRLGQVADLDFVFRHILAIGGAGSEGLDNAAEGVSQRGEWFARVIQLWSSDIHSIFFGLGYGIPLIDFVIDQGTIVREPHNSMLTELARLGLVGCIGMLLIQASLFMMGFKTVRYAKQLGDVVVARFVEIVIVYSLVVWVFSITEDGMQKPFNAVTYYFLWGVVLKVRFEQLKISRVAKSSYSKYK